MDQIEKAAKVLKQGGVIAYPTETVYGLGADIFNLWAVDKIFKLKGREFDQPISVAVDSFKMIEDLCVLSSKQKKIVSDLLPGPLTVVLPKKGKIPSRITAQKDSVGIRFPKHPLAQKIIEKVGFPITSTSANLSGEEPAVNYNQVDLKVDFVVKGECKYKKPSTVVDLIQGSILRKGVGLKQALKFI